jgi:hypothetical protein
MNFYKFPSYFFSLVFLSGCKSPFLNVVVNSESSGSIDQVSSPQVPAPAVPTPPDPGEPNIAGPLFTNDLTPECSNGVDDDWDGLIDLVDQGCLNGEDLYESDNIENGWTVIAETPSPAGTETGTRKIYVSSSIGDDSNPGTEAYPLATIGRALREPPASPAPTPLNLARNGFPDWVLLKRGDTFFERVSINLSGRSPSEPFVLGAYGTGPRPKIHSGLQGAIIANLKNHIAIFDLDLRAQLWTGGQVERPTAISFMNSSHVTIEGVKIENFHTGIVIQNCCGNARISGIRLRRNSVLGSYTTHTDTHAGGLYLAGADQSLIAENTFDHNGWNEDVPGAGTTIFRRNGYFQDDNSDLIFKGNISARAASDSIQMRSGGWAFNNSFFKNGGLSLLFARAPVGIPPTNIRRIEHNVIIGSRNINSTNLHGWGMRIQSAQNTVVNGNIVKDVGSEATSIISGITLTSGTTDVAPATGTQVIGNKIYNWANTTDPNSSALNLEHAIDTVVEGNDFVMPDGGLAIVHGRYTTGTVLTQNRHYSTNALPFLHVVYPNFNLLSFASWIALLNETQSTFALPVYPDPDRDAGTYMAYLGYGPSQQNLESFLTEVRLQSKENWRPQFTADAFNAYIRQGF